MKNARSRNVLSLLCNLALAALVAYAMSWFYTDIGRGNMAVGGNACYRFFTVDSNILAALCGLVLIPFNIKGIAAGEDRIPKWALTLKYIGTVAVSLTLIVVVVFLGPTQGYALMFDGNCLYLHLINPLLAMVSFCCFETAVPLTKKQMLLGLIPTFVYGTVYLFVVWLFPIWPDFYGFTRGGLWYVSYIAMHVGTLIICLAERAVHNAFCKVKA